MPKYRKKPVVVEAVQWTGENIDEIRIFAEENAMFEWLVTYCALFIETMEGIMTASRGDYIIKGVEGEFYPCKPDIFEKAYERVEEDD